MYPVLHEKPDKMHKCIRFWMKNPTKFDLVGQYQNIWDAGEGLGKRFRRVLGTKWLLICGNNRGIYRRFCLILNQFQQEGPTHNKKFACDNYDKKWVWVCNDTRALLLPRWLVYFKHQQCERSRLTWRWMRWGLASTHSVFCCSSIYILYTSNHSCSHFFDWCAFLAGDE